jgi:annexin A7/11
MGQRAEYDASRQADELRKAMKGMGTDEATLIRILAPAGPLEIPVIKDTYQQRHRRSLESDVKSETGGYFELGLMSILMGPLQHDVWSVHEAVSGAGTKESLLDDVLIGRSNADMNAIKQAYQHTYHRSLESDVRSDLSAKTERMYAMILAATRQEDSAPVVPQAVDADVNELHRATEGKLGTDQLTVCSILTNRSDAHIRAIAHAYEQRYRLSLELVLKKEFSGHMEDALIRMVRSGTDRFMRDAVGLEECMKGPGTKDQMLVNRVVRAHWDRAHMAQVRGAYRAKYGRDLVSRIKGETSGDYERLLVAMVS